ncbi:MAG TPA: efflux transporter outer membrane subunit [Candidatus Competibacter sp.]|nr:RND transporter [Candidatus Competibacteraceae bacterium]HRC73366.1 efflux transporter outer membrane subunit [Candidatus Competibacter sp.]
MKTSLRHSPTTGSARFQRRETALLAILALAFGGCAAVGPDYVAPVPAAPATWQSAAAARVGFVRATPEELARWWRQLDDPVLTQLVEQALQTSLDLRTAQAKLREARARRALVATNHFPTVTASGAVNVLKGSAETGAGKTRELYSAGFDASWEPDVFGGQRRSEEAAQADLEAMAENLYAVQVSLAAEAALNYVELRAYQERLAIARANVASQAETLQLVQWRAQAGLVSTLDVEQARSNLAQTRAQIPALETGFAEARDRLEILLGQTPGALAGRWSDAAALPRAPTRVMVAIPADTLRQRPDVRAAERKLAAETARIGEAEAGRYPSFNLSGSLGLEAPSLGALAGTDALARSVLGSVVAPIFDAGRIRQQIAIQTAVQEQAFISYQATVLNALSEVENALVALANTRERRKNLQEAVQATQQAATLARQRYSSGLIDFQTVLDTERSVLNLEDNLKSSQAEHLFALIRLYKALGGGWSPAAADQTAVSVKGNPS